MMRFTWETNAACEKFEAVCSGKGRYTREVWRSRHLPSQPAQKRGSDA